MKLAPRDAAAYFARPDPKVAGLLIYGADAMRVALKRQQVIAALIGPEGDAEMRLDRLSGAELRATPAALQDAMRAQGFFPGPRVVFVEGATDGLARDFDAALAEWAPGDAHLVATAGALGKGSALRKTFEGSKRAYAAAIYDDPPGRAEVAAMLDRAGLRDVPGAVQADLMTLAAEVDPGEFAQILEKLALYTRDAAGPPSSEDLAAVLPMSTEAATDDLIDAVADGRHDRLASLLARLRGQGVTPVALTIAAARHFRTLHAAAAYPGGASEGVARLRPPVFGPRRDRLTRQAGRWSVPRLEQAHALILEADLALRGGGATAPQAALIERALFRVSFLAPRG